VNEVVARALAEARALGFLGPGEVESHEVSAGAFLAGLSGVDGRVLDLGSGGGVPGLLLADLRPDLAWVLLDSSRRRTSFLARVVGDLGWADRVVVRRAMAEEAAHDPDFRAGFSAVTARSFGPPPLTAESAVGFLAPGGRLLVAEPPEATANRWDRSGLAALGLERRPDVGVPSGRVAVLELVGDVDAGIPRSRRDLDRRPRW
jgi:16S rRNA (guanine527-N7)-methyltransferase